MTQTPRTQAELMTDGFERKEIDGKAYMVKKIITGNRRGLLSVFVAQVDGTLSPVTDPSEFLAVKKVLEKGAAPEKPLQDSMHPTREELQLKGYTQIVSGKDTFMLRVASAVVSHSGAIYSEGPSSTAQTKGVLSSRRSSDPRGGRDIESAYVLGSDGLYTEVEPGQKKGQMDELRRRFADRLTLGKI